MSSDTTAITQREWISDLSAPSYLKGYDAAGVVEGIVKDSQSSYMLFEQWGKMRTDHRDVKAQFKIVKAQGVAFNKTLSLSLGVSEQGRRLADDTLFLCQKLQQGAEFDHMSVLDTMITRSKKGAQLAHEVMTSFTGIRGNLIQVNAALPDIADKIERDLAANTEKLDRIMQKFNSNSGAKGFFSFFQRRTREKVEANQRSLSNDKDHNASLEGLDKVIEAVSVLVDWWDENVRRLEKLRDDGFDARVNEAIDPIVAERMAYEWKVIGKQYTWYSSKIKLLSQNFTSRQRQSIRSQ